MLRIGLTGGIGSGKTTVAKIFSELKVPVVDADAIVYQICQPKKAAFNRIIKHFGPEYLTKTKELDRKKLRQLIFNNQTEREWLENLLHPLVYAKIKQCIAKINAPYCILSIPLLFETKATKLVDRILVIDCPKIEQIKRIIKRDQIDALTVKKIINTQIKRQKRLKLADDVISNQGTLAKLKQSVIMQHQKYLELGQKH